MGQSSFAFEAIGTDWRIKVDQELSIPKRQEVLKAILDRIEQFDRAYSRFRPDSLVSEMAERAGTYLLPDDAPSLVNLFHQLWTLSHGLFTPMIGQTLVDAGYDATYQLKPKSQLHRPSAWADVLSFDGQALTLYHPTLLDFGAGGKGYLIDIISQVLCDLSLPNHLIDAGGDIVHKTTREEVVRVGLENPSNLKQVIGVAQLQNQSICGSAGNRRAWDEFHHIINPKTLKSPTHLLATWVVAETGLLADAISTALFFVPAEQLLTEFKFEYATLTADYAIHRSSAFPAEFFII